MQPIYSTNSREVYAGDTHKVLRNTYSFLACTLVFSAITAAASVALGIGYGLALIGNLVALALLWFVLPRTAQSGAGVGVVFAITGLLGAGIGPLLSHFLALPHGGLLVMQALAGTALVFFALSAYVLTTGKNFSFMGGFLMVGLISVLITIVGSMVLGLFGVQISGLSMAINGVIVLLMSGFILYDTSRIIHGGETNYIMATVSLYLDILNLFTSLLQLLGFFSKDD
ncbi:MAG: Bax inhibitor-1/YccA family protein [Moraxellaceae bacterium]|jgi:modulator of FtsH protease|nr:MAG: Bax inhibitor-1/YccA family protein [Moraxellaceae bacterium]